MEYRVLGPLEVRDGERSLPLAGAKQRALLALLLGEREPRRLARPVDRRALGRAAARDGGARACRSTSRGCASCSPSDALLTRPPGYLLEVEPDELDLRRFERLLAEGREALAAGDPERAARRPARRARTLARPGAGGVRVRAVRAGGDRPARRPAAGGGRRADRGRPRARPPRRPDRRARGADRREPPPRAAARPADARALPLRPTGRGARGLPGCAPRARRRARASSRATSCSDSRSRSSRTTPRSKRRPAASRRCRAPRPCAVPERKNVTVLFADLGMTDEDEEDPEEAGAFLDRDPRRSRGRDRSRRRHRREGPRRRAARHLRSGATRDRTTTPSAPSAPRSPPATG